MEKTKVLEGEALGLVRGGGRDRGTPLSQAGICTLQVTRIGDLRAAIAGPSWGKRDADARRGLTPRQGRRYRSSVQRG